MKKFFSNLFFGAGILFAAILICSCKKSLRLTCSNKSKRAEKSRSRWKAFGRRGLITMKTMNLSDSMWKSQRQSRKNSAFAQNSRKWNGTGFFAGMDSKRYDIALNGVEITPEREQKYDFSIPYGYIHTALIVRDDNSEINSFEDLKGKTSTNSLGSTYADLAESYGANIITIDTLEETIQLVEHRRADATLNADVSFMDYIKAHPDAPVKIVALTEDASQIAIPIRKGKENETLKAALNSAIEELRADGTISAISQKYFGKDIAK